jgi:hypothetical protein
MLQIALKGQRKPSKAYIMRTIGVCLENGHKHFELSWGENWLEFIRAGYQWHGSGWIKDISGDDIARELNQLTVEVKNAF